MDRKKANAIFKGSLIAMTVLLWEGSGICRNPYPVWAADESSQYGQYGTFDMGNSEAAGKIGTDIGDASPSLGEHKAHRQPKIKESRGYISVRKLQIPLPDLRWQGAMHHPTTQ